ncbi:MAG: DUF5335 family protein [Candidatus Limnocylindrales bacterium]
MTDKQQPGAADLEDVPREEWASWCEKITSDHNGREVLLRQADRALGEVQLAAGQRLVSLEYDRFGKTEALTIKCGSHAVPVSYVVAEPRSIGERRDQSGVTGEVSIVDATGRRTSVDFG